MRRPIPRPIDTISSGDLVRFVTPEGKELTGTASVRAPYGDNSWLVRVPGVLRLFTAAHDNMTRVVHRISR